MWDCIAEVPLNLKIITGIAIIGAIATSAGNPLLACILWSVSNPLLAWHNHGIGQKEQYGLFCVFTIIAWVGVVNLW